MSGFYGNNEDVIEIEFLGNGLCKISTDPISNANHANAENLLDEIEKASGSNGIIEQKHGHDHHHHHHNEEHHHHH